MNRAGALLLAVSLAASADVTPTPKAVVQAMFAAFNRHDADALARLYASDVRLSSSDFCAVRTGREEVARTYRELFAAFPDIRDEVVQTIFEGNRVAVRFVAKSDMAAKPLRLPIATFLEIRQGRIVSDDSLFDTGGRACLP